STSKTPSYTKSVSWQHHQNTGFLDSDAQRCTFVCRYSEINQKIRRGRSLVQQPDQKPLTQQGLTV
ncbi:hypothetical protein, partial [Escherichia coli]|uniref:hypothetical protein n=1 Tax=Escherichia coli TaxID=562 RepID=UPI0030056701